MSYTDIGFDQFFQREIIPSTPDDRLISSFDFSSQVQNTSGDQIKGGLIQSQNQKVSLNLDKENFVISDGVNDRVTLGRLPDDSYGLLIRDEDGNILMQISGLTNLIQSPNGHFQVDFNEERLLAKDAGGTPRVLIGKGDF